MISVFVDDEALQDPALRQRIHNSLVDHIVTLFEHLFMGVKPSKPAQSRWTGVASVSQFALCLGLCHKMLQPLLSLLTAKDTGTTATTADNDADARASTQVCVCVCVTTCAFLFLSYYLLIDDQ